MKDKFKNFMGTNPSDFSQWKGNSSTTAASGHSSIPFEVRTPL